jgi:hypothetical protein
LLGGIEGGYAERKPSVLVVLLFVLIVKVSSRQGKNVISGYTARELRVLRVKGEQENSYKNGFQEDEKEVT